MIGLSTRLMLTLALIATPALASDDCAVPMTDWQPREAVVKLAAENGWVPLPDRLLTVLEAGLAISRQTGGAFEMNIGDAVRAWGFGPDLIDLQAIRAASTAQRVPASAALELDQANGLARKAAPLTLDLSAIAKGYGVDRLAETARGLGINHALCTIDGELRALGTRQDGRPWAVGIETPDSAATGQHSVLDLKDTAVATSGDYRHFVSVGTARLSRTMDPRRAAPLVADPASVTVLSQSCMMADAMATALMVMGSGLGIDFAKDQAISALFLDRSTAGTTAVGTGKFATTTDRQQTALRHG